MSTWHPDEGDLLDARHNLLEPAQANAIQEHLRGCPACRARAEHLQRQFATLQTLQRDEPVPERLVAGILREVRKEKVVRKPAFPTLKWLAGVAAAAALLLIFLHPLPLSQDDAHMPATLQVATSQPGAPAVAPPELKMDLADAAPAKPLSEDIAVAEQRINDGAAPPSPPIQIFAFAAPTPRQTMPAKLAGAVRMRSESSKLAMARADSRAAPAPSALPFSAVLAESSPSTFNDFTLEEKPDRDIRNFHITSINTNPWPLHVSMTIRLDSAWRMTSREATLTPIEPQAWRLELDIPASTQRTAIIEVTPAP